MKHALLTLTALSLILASSHAKAEQVTTSQIELARHYVQLNMGIRALGTPVVDQDRADYARALKANGLPGSRSKAAYRNGTIYLAPYFKYEWDMPYLVHEMTHYSQSVTGKKYKCHAAREREAYEMQNSFALKFGYPRAVVSEEFINRASECD